MEDVIAEARARTGGPGEPGASEARFALAALEAVDALAGRRVRLERSDGSAAAFGLAREAVWWALKAHAARDQADPPDSDLPALWEEGMRHTPGQATSGLDAAVVDQARCAFLSRGWEQAASPDDVRLGELRALREVAVRLVGPLEADMTRLARLRIMRALRWAASLAAIAAIVVGVLLAWRAHKRGPNLALHKPTTASSLFSGYDTSAGAVDGNTSDLGVHTTQQDKPWIVIDLGDTKQIRQVVVYNRADCCKDRAIPLLVETSVDGRDYREVARQEAEFSKWKAVFPPTEARYVRVKVGKKSFLHLNEIEVYPGE